MRSRSTGPTGNEVRPSLLKQAHVMLHANRIGAARTKSRGMVKGSTRKLYRQKGTGNARVGNARTVVRKGGGVAFAMDANTGKWRQKMPRRMRQLANCNALLAKLVDSEVSVLTRSTWPSREHATSRARSRTARSNLPHRRFA